MGLLDSFILILICPHSKTTKPPIELSDIADIAQVLIALANLYLVYRVFNFDKKDRKDKKEDDDIKIINSIRLQGFKDFIVTPNFSHLQNFFENLLQLKQRIIVPVIDEELSIELNTFIKSEVSKFRINFNDAILNVNRQLFDSIKLKVENLNDHLILVISDGNFDLTNQQEFEELIAYPINYTKNEVISLLVKYKGD